MFQSITMKHLSGSSSNAPAVLSQYTTKPWKSLGNWEQQQQQMVEAGGNNGELSIRINLNLNWNCTKIFIQLNNLLIHSIRCNSSSWYQTSRGCAGRRWYTTETGSIAYGCYWASVFYLLMSLLSFCWCFKFLFWHCFLVFHLFYVTWLSKKQKIYWIQIASNRTVASHCLQVSDYNNV